MNVIIFTLSGQSALYSSLARHFVKNGHRVVMVTYTSDESHFDEVNMIKIIYFHALPLTNCSMIKKGIANLLLPYYCMKYVKKRLKQYHPDLIFSTTPPLGFYIPIRWLKKNNNGSKYYIILRDIWPEAFNLFDFDKKHPLIYTYFRYQERQMYKYADFIGCMSQGNIDFVKRSNPEISIDKLVLLPNWGDVKNYEEVNNNKIREKYNLVGKYVLIYGGNIGIPQGIDNILDLAEQKLYLKDVVFLLIGKGTEKEYLKNEVQCRHLENVIVMDFLPSKDYECLLQISDVGVISLNAKLKTPSIPSKTISYWNLKKPILAIIDAVTDYGENIIDASQSGLWALAINKQKIYDNFDKLYNNKDYRKQLGLNGYNYLLNNCTTKHIYNDIIKQVYGK